MRKRNRVFSVFVLALAVTGTVITTGCNSGGASAADEKAAAKDGQAAAFRAQQGGAGKPAAK